MERHVLGPRSRVAVAMNVLTEFSKRAESDLIPAELALGDGSYRCLALLDAQGDVVVALNLLGEAALVGDVVIPDIWPVASRNPRLAAMQLLDEGEIDCALELDLQKARSVAALARIASLLTMNVSSKVSVQWGWQDHPFESTPNPRVADFPDIPDHWRNGIFTESSLEWQAALFLVVDEDGTSLAAINTALDEIVLREVSRLDFSARTEFDEDGLPSVPVGAQLTDKASGRILVTDVHASMARYMAKLLMEEHLSVVSVEPIFEFDDALDSVSLWNTAEGLYAAEVGDYLD